MRFKRLQPKAHGGFLETLGADHRRTTGAAEALADLYMAWREAEPDAGHDAQAEQWQAKLPREEPTDGGAHESGG